MSILNGKLSLSSVLHFGKYKGYTVEEVIEENPGYLTWAQDNIDNFELDTTAQRELDAAENDRELDGFDPRDDYYK